MDPVVDRVLVDFLEIIQELVVVEMVVVLVDLVGPICYTVWWSGSV